MRPRGIVDPFLNGASVQAIVVVAAAAVPTAIADVDNEPVRRMMSVPSIAVSRIASNASPKAIARGGL